MASELLGSSTHVPRRIVAPGIGTGGKGNGHKVTLSISIDSLVHVAMFEQGTIGKHSIPLSTVPLGLLTKPCMGSSGLDAPHNKLWISHFLSLLEHLIRQNLLTGHLVPSHSWLLLGTGPFLFLRVLGETFGLTERLHGMLCGRRNRDVKKATD